MIEQDPIGSNVAQMRLEPFMRVFLQVHGLERSSPGYKQVWDCQGNVGESKSSLLRSDVPLAMRGVIVARQAHGLVVVGLESVRVFFPLWPKAAQG